MTRRSADCFTLQQRHGKERVRLGRVWRNPDGLHLFVEWIVGISLLSDCDPAYTRDDNSSIVATDTMKNTVYVKAKHCPQQISVEEFAILLARHFISFYDQVTTAIIKITEKPWERVHVDGKPHNHGFKLGGEKHTVEIIATKSGMISVKSGIESLALLKTTQSGFEGFVTDKYTLLPETRERILATEVTASWSYAFENSSTLPQNPSFFCDQYLTVKKTLLESFFGPLKQGVYSPSVQATLYQMANSVLNRCPDVSSVKLKMPNIHFLPVNLLGKDNFIVVKFEDDVYLPTDEPHGSIEATLSRVRSKM